MTRGDLIKLAKSCVYTDADGRQARIAKSRSLHCEILQIIAALEDAERLEAEVERLTAQASACPWCRPVREIFTEAT